MSRIPGIALFALAALTACQQPRAQIKPANMGFSLEMPGPASEKIQKIQGANGPFDLHLHQSDRDGGRYIYTVAYEDLELGSSDPQVIFRPVIQAVVGTDRLISQTEYQQNGNPAIEVRTAVQGKNLRVTRLVLAHGKMIQLAVRLPFGEQLPEDGRRFFDSLRIDPAAEPHTPR